MNSCTGIDGSVLVSYRNKRPDLVLGRWIFTSGKWEHRLPPHISVGDDESEIYFCLCRVEFEFFIQFCCSHGLHKQPGLNCLEIQLEQYPSWYFYKVFQAMIFLNQWIITKNCNIITNHLLRECVICLYRKYSLYVKVHKLLFLPIFLLCRLFSNSYIMGQKMHSL